MIIIGELHFENVFYSRIYFKNLSLEVERIFWFFWFIFWFFIICKLKITNADNTVNVMIRIQMALLILLDIRLLCVIQRGKNLQLVKQLPIVSPKI